MSTTLSEDDLLIDLRTLADLQVDWKTTGDQYLSLEPPGPFQWIVRYLRGDSRYKTVERVKKIVQYCIDFCQTHNECLSLAAGLVTERKDKEKDPHPVEFDLSARCRERFLRLEILTQGMREALPGIQKLETTYHQSIGAQVRVCAIKLEKQIVQNDKHLEHFRPLYSSSSLREPTLLPT